MLNIGKNVRWLGLGFNDWKKVERVNLFISYHHQHFVLDVFLVFLILNKL